MASKNPSLHSKKLKQLTIKKPNIRQMIHNGAKLILGFYFLCRVDFLYRVLKQDKKWTTLSDFLNDFLKNWV